MEQKIKQDQSIGENIRTLRMQKGLAQWQVAAQWQILGVDRTTNFYSHVEAGTYNIKVSELIALRKIFNCSYEDFFRGLD